MSSLLCGQSRPDHFRGVATIVLKLFNIVRPDIAVFGWKDAQQLLIVQKLVKDLNLPINIIGIETVREPDGLAMSSRNAYLSHEERLIAPLLYAALKNAKQRLLNGTDPSQVQNLLADELATQPSMRLDYASVVSLDDLSAPVAAVPGPLLVAAAVRLGKTRLIDNIRVTMPEPGIPVLL
jgi:pantoate--beta-alanine ligase